MAMEVPQLTMEALKSLKQKIGDYTAMAKDFENLDQFLATLKGDGLVRKMMNAKGFNTYQDYINELSKPENRRDIVSVAYVRGYCITLTEALEKYMLDHN